VVEALAVSVRRAAQTARPEFARMSHGRFALLPRHACGEVYSGPVVVQVSSRESADDAVSPNREGLVSGSLSSVCLLRASDPVYLRPHGDADGSQPSRPLRCGCGGPQEWLIVAEHGRVLMGRDLMGRVLMVCGCGRRQSLEGATLDQVVALAREEAIRPEWSVLEDALRDLGFLPRTVRGPRGPADVEVGDPAEPRELGDPLPTGPGFHAAPADRRAPVLGFHAPRWWRAFGIRPYRHTAPLP
jgi:hypothetical protein